MIFRIRPGALTVAFIVAISVCASPSTFANSASSAVSAAKSLDTAAPLLLRFRPAAGARYITHFSSGDETEDVVEGWSSKSSRSVSGTYSTVVLKSDASGVTLRSQVMALKAWWLRDGYREEYNSAKPPPFSDLINQNYESRTLMGIIGGGFTYQISNDGRLLKMSGGNEALKRIPGQRKPPSEEYLDSLRPLMDDYIASIFNLMQRLSPTQRIYAKAPLTVGGKWTSREIYRDGKIPTPNDITFTLSSRQAGVASVAFSGSVLEGNRTGAIQVDEKSGVIQSFVETQELKPLTALVPKGVKEFKSRMKVTRKATTVQQPIKK